MRKIICHLEVENSSLVACGLSKSKVYRADNEIFQNIIDVYNEFGEDLIDKDGVKLIASQVTVPCEKCLEIYKQ